MEEVLHEESRQLITDREFEEAVKKMDVEAEEINTKKEKKQELVTENKNIENYKRTLDTLNEFCIDKDKVDCTRCTNLHYEIELREKQLIIDRNSIEQLKTDFDKLKSGCSLKCNSCNKMDEIKHKITASETKIMEIRGFLNPWWHNPIREDDVDFYGGSTKFRIKNEHGYKKSRKKRILRKKNLRRSKKNRK